MSRFIDSLISSEYVKPPLLDKEPCRLYSGNPDWRDVRVVDGGGLENR